MNGSILKNIDLPNGDIISEVELLGEGRWEDDGIGSYEFWGMRGYDSRPYIEVVDVTFDKEAYSKEDCALINQWIDDNYGEVYDEFSSLFKMMEG